ncbi:MAG: hypothetical protein KIG60_04755, partial [Caryophanon sp.]|nr:hypothetical protein [Caryophanon sp.]
VFFATVKTFFLERKLPRVLLRIFLRSALEATELSYLGIIVRFYGVSDPTERRELPKAGLVTGVKS